MIGGEHDMYFTTELWENWTDIFAAMRAQREEQGKSLWINFTCYVNPSPWFFAMGQFHLDAEQWRPFLPNPIEGRLQRGFRRRPDDDLSRRPIF